MWHLSILPVAARLHAILCSSSRRGVILALVTVLTSHLVQQTSMARNAAGLDGADSGRPSDVVLIHHVLLLNPYVFANGLLMVSPALSPATADGSAASEIRRIVAGRGLDGGGDSGDVTLYIASSGITTSMLDREAVTDSKIADVSPRKIDGYPGDSSRYLNGAGQWTRPGGGGGRSGGGTPVSAGDGLSSRVIFGEVTLYIPSSAITSSMIDREAVTDSKIADVSPRKIDGYPGDRTRYLNGAGEWTRPGGNGAGSSVITSLIAGSGLSGGGSTGHVALSIRDSGISTSMIENGAITDDKVVGISARKINGYPGDRSRYLNGMGEWTSPPAGSRWESNGNNISYHDGRVGIGTASPSDRLDVRLGGISSQPGRDGDANIRVYSFDRKTSGAIAMSNAGDLCLSAERGIEVRLDDAMSIMNKTGSAYRPIHASAFIQSSSRQYKTDIEYLDNEAILELLDAVCAMRPAVYTLADDAASGERQVGFIAEEVPLELATKDGTGIDLYRLTTVNTAALKGLRSRTEQELEKLRAEKDAEIAAQQREIEELRKRVAEMEAVVQRLVAELDD